MSTCYYIRDTNIGFIDEDDGTPVAINSSDTLEMYYKKYDTALSSDSSSPTFPSRFHPAIVEKVLSKLFARQGNEAGVIFSDREYQRYVRSARSFNKRFYTKTVRQYDY